VSDRPTGLLVPVTTPFDRASGDVAPVSLRDNTRTVLDAGANGVVAAGSTGEAPLLAEHEYGSVLEWLRDVVPDDRWLVAGAGRESTRATIDACRVAAAAGADAVLVRPPAYFAPSLSPQDIVVHFRRVADASPVPLLVYNMPKYTHVALAAAQLADLVDHENIWGAKDSSGDLKNFAAYRDAVPAWSLFVGSGALYYAGLELGAAGAVAAVGCFAAGPLAEVGAAFAAGDRGAAGGTQERLAPLHTEIVGAAGIAGVKAAMDLVGLAGGPVRAPLSDLGDRERDRVEVIVRQAGLLDG
jgi:4-hydroxy-2-oxoglutarate aldolase